MSYQPRHRKVATCPVCSPESARRLQQIQNRRQGGYSPPPRCAAHPLDLRKIRPAGAAVVAR